MVISQSDNKLVPGTFDVTPYKADVTIVERFPGVYYLQIIFRVLSLYFDWVKLVVFSNSANDTIEVYRIAEVDDDTEVFVPVSMSDNTPER